MFRRLLFVLAWGMIAVSTVHGQDWARALFKENLHDFGSVPRGGKAEYRFDITNNLAADVHIASVRTSCNCTTPTIENNTLKSYEKGAILAHLNSDTHIGHRQATLTVTIDRPMWAEVQLQVKAWVHDDVLMEPASLNFGSVSPGATPVSAVRIYRNNSPTWQILRAQVSNPNLTVELKELARQGSQVWYDLQVKLASGTPAGYINDTVTLTTNDASSPQIPVAVEGLVRPELVVTPNSLFLGVLKPGEKVTKQLIVRSDKPFRISSISADKASFELPAGETESKMVHVVPVTFVAGAEVGKVVKTIHVTTDLPNGNAEATSYAVVSGDK